MRHYTTMQTQACRVCCTRVCVHRHAAPRELVENVRLPTWMRIAMRAYLVLLSLLLLAPHARAAEAQAPEEDAATQARAVMSVEQVVQILDETVDWYRTLGTQQQEATQPSDLLIVYANRQTADKVVGLAFEVARANAELISSEADVARAKDANSAAQSLNQSRKQLDDRRAAIQEEIDAGRRELAAAPQVQRADLQERLTVLQRQLDMANARRNLLNNMAQFSSETDANGFGANALKAHIDAIAASIPSATSGGTSASAPPASDAQAAATEAGGRSFTQFGIWDLTATVFRLSAKIRTIESIDRRTAEMQEVYTRTGELPNERLKLLTARSDALAAQADSATSTALRSVRDEYDTLAWLFRQTSSILTPLSKAGVLLGQYRRNLSSWRDATERQYYEALKALGIRVAVFVALLALVFALAELWQRAVFRYVPEARRRSRFLLLRKIMLWVLVVAIAASTFATELGSLATFAGLITAGLAVAMQSVLVSVVGYFFLIGKYGIRIGDRVQIGSVTGEVIDLGLVRMHLMELSGNGPTGRVVAFANSIIFQASGGLFKQIPGVNLAWHEISLALPTGSDYAKLKDKLTEAVKNVLADYGEDIARQAQAIQRAASSDAGGDTQPQVQLRFSVGGVEALVRYPVQLTHAAEIDERVSRELLNVISAHGGVLKDPGTPQLA
jgi:small-conductance mechanosensitive channel